MKSILAVALIAGFVAAEVPSHSYLPPPPHRGYSSGPVTPKTFETTHQPDHHIVDQIGDHADNGFAKNGQPGHELIGHDPASHDPATHDPTGHGVQSRFGDEPGYDQNAAGYPRNGLEDVNATVSYEADEQGYKPQISYEESEDIIRPTYGTNTNFRSNGYHGNAQDGAHNNGYRSEQNGGRPNARSNYN